MFRAVYANIIPVSEFCDFKRRAEIMSPSEYRARAEECKALAERTTDLSIKLLYQELADRWYDLAKQIERYGLGSRIENGGR